MPVASIPNFVGGSYPPYENIIGLERTVNWYAESASPGTSAKRAFINCPGYALWQDLPGTPGRGIFYQDGRGFAVSGPLFCEIFANQTFTVRGSVAVDANMTTISSNGLSQGGQIFIVSGGRGYIYDLITNAFTDVTSQSEFPAPATSGFYLDGYFGAIMANSPTFALSNLFDGTTWNILQGGQQSQSLTVDNIQNGYAINGKVWFLGSKNTEIWADIGASDFPLAPIPGALPRWGLNGIYTLAAIDNALMGVGQNDDGSLEVIRANGFDWQVVSTPAISNLLRINSASMVNARAWTYAQQNHAFYLLYVPSLPTTLVYDVTTHLWHERALYDTNNMRYVPDLGISHAYGFGLHLVQDRQSGAIYTMDLSQLTMNVILSGPLS
jgi:hypothetical protein